MDFNKIKESAKGYESKMTSFLRDLIAIPGESAEEGSAQSGEGGPATDGRDG